MQVESDAKIRQTLLTHLGHWTWARNFYTYDDSHLIITEPYITAWVRKARTAALKCQMTTPDAYERYIGDDVRKIMVFLEQGELPLVKKLKQQYPDKVITSGTYGYACVGRDRLSRLRPFPEPFKPKRKPRLILMLTTPYADGEYIAAMMGQNGLPAPHEFLARPFNSWLRLHRPFQIGRFYNSVLKWYAKAGVLPWLLQTDVLATLFANSSLSRQRFLQFLKKRKVKIIVVNRRYTTVQAALGQFLERTVERSVWTKKPDKKMKLAYQVKDMVGVGEQAQKIAWGQSFQDDLVTAGLSHLPVEMEAFAENPEEGIRQIAAFLGKDAPEKVTADDYTDAFENAHELITMSDTFFRDFIDRAGLHVR